MAQDSKKKRRERRLKRKNTMTRMFPLLQRNFELETKNRQQEVFVTEANKSASVARVLLMAIIGQQGGTVEVTKGTIQQVHENMGNLGWTTSQKEGDANTVVITLVTDAGTQDPAPTVSEQAIDVTPVDSNGDPLDDGETSTEDVVVDDHEVSRFADEGNPHHDDWAV